MEISERRYQELRQSFGSVQQGGPAGRTVRMQTPSIGIHSEVRHFPRQQAALPKALTHVAGNVKEILLVDPEGDRLRAAQYALCRVADVVACDDFRTARAQLLARPPDLLVTNLRLEAYNGLHLVHLTEGTLTRCIVYGIYDDQILAQEVQAAGAFYERSRRIPLALPSYVHAVLPPHDRRDLNVLDRRRTDRGGGGRRCTEL